MQEWLDASSTISEEAIADIELMYKWSNGHYAISVQDLEGHIRQEEQSCDVTADLDVGGKCRWCTTPVTSYDKTTAMESYVPVLDGWNIVEYQHVDRSNEENVTSSGFYSQAKKQFSMDSLMGNGWRLFFATNSGYHPHAPAWMWAERTPSNGNWWVVTETHTPLCDLHRESKMISMVSGTRQLPGIS